MPTFDNQVHFPLNIHLTKMRFLLLKVLLYFFSFLLSSLLFSSLIMFNNMFFNNKINKIDREIDILYKQNQLLTRQRDLLLPRLMSGKLEVKS